MSYVLTSPNTSKAVRSAAALQLKNHVTSKDDRLKGAYQRRWLALPPTTRSVVKSNIVAALDSESAGVSQCIAYVAAAELTALNNDWPDLMPSLSMHALSQHCSERVKEAVLQTIEFICQEIVTDCLVFS